MGKLFKRGQLRVWIACFAILLNALAPSISHAISARDGQASAWVEVCTAGGSKRVAVAPVTPADTAPSDHSIAHQSEHCPFCMSHAGSFSLPPPSMAPLAASGGHALFPALFYRSPRPLFSWATANPRAPPATS
ncbi:DUF2946 domain-containing protein [Herminiimonas sp. CN]|uniref:DUF2946 domain-containing protein n=1 Tax=Herminiimonas sp. CN TaxID=1349818 RepID=UPI0004732BAE|nr:DUF2946 domain-containing protein [Herminiimonas sp. CN]